MKTRIRELRKQRGLTLQQLADLVGTTAQTVQRLETANMTVSTDWLERFATAFGIHPADLIAGGPNRSIEWLGTLNSEGGLNVASGEPDGFVLDVPALDPLAVRVGYTLGPYTADTILIANRLKGKDLANAHGADCLVALQNGPILLRRIIAGQDGTVTLVPLNPGQDVSYDQKIEWLGRIVMTVRYL